MGKNERCLWIVSAFIDHGDMSFKELNERFLQYSLNYDGEVIHSRTFDRDRRYIALTFQIDIDFDPHIKKYHLANPEEIQSNPIYKYLLDSIHVAELSDIALKHKNKLMLQSTPTGAELLNTLLTAIDQEYSVCFDYTSYYKKDEINSYEMIPCFLRQFERRWYLIAEGLEHDKVRTFALERMKNLRIGKKHCLPSSNITPEIYYQDCYGVIHDDKKPETILLKVYNNQVSYVRSTPIHTSQKEIETTDDYAVFQYYLRPSYDFIQRIFWNRENIEVLQPQSLRNEVRDLLQKTLERYS